MNIETLILSIASGVVGIIVGVFIGFFLYEMVISPWRRP